jgi:phosphatidylserine/phosphatidylglycerophosphate/cardiolipin synthase-like enzyme
MATTEIEGTVYRLYPKEQVTQNFAKRELVLKEDGEYPNFIKIEAAGKQIDLLDNVIEENFVRVRVAINGREYTTKDGKQAYFNSLRLLGVEVYNYGKNKFEPPQAPPPDPHARTITPAEKTGFITPQEDDDLPF